MITIHELIYNSYEKIKYKIVKLMLIKQTRKLQDNKQLF